MTKLWHFRFVAFLIFFVLIGSAQPASRGRRLSDVALPTATTAQLVRTALPHNSVRPQPVPYASRLIVVLFTGFTIGAGESSGMSDLLTEIQADPALAGAVGQVFTYDDPPSPVLELPHQTALNWVQAQHPTAADKIVLIGHSYGGNRARLFSGDLALRGLPARAVVTIDPIEWYQCNPQTYSAFGCLLCLQSNYLYPVLGYVPIKKSYAQIGDSCIRGYKITPAVTIVNGAIHTTIDNNPLVHQGIRQLLASL